MTREPKRMLARWLPPTAPWLLIVTALGALILAILPHLNFLGGGLIPVLQALIPAACLAVLVLSVPLLIFRKTRLPGLIVLVGALVGGFPALVPTASMGDAQSEQLTILSLNAEVGGANVGELSDLILARGADLVVLVEVDEAFLAELLSTRVAQELPYRSGTVSAGGIPGSVVLSRYALVDEGDVPLPAGVTVFDHPIVQVDHPALGPIRVAAIHPFPPIAGAADWHESLAAINDWQAGQTDLPLVLAGDFNAGYAHPAFRGLAADFANTAAARGRIPVPTWPATGSIPAFTAIDHVLVRDLAPTSWERVQVADTDHFGILARVTTP